MSDQPPTVDSLSAMVAELMGQSGPLAPLARALAVALVDQQQRTGDQRPVWLSRRMAVVSAVNVDLAGLVTADVNLAGRIVPGVAVQSTYGPQVGDIVWLEFSGPDPHISPPLHTADTRRWRALATTNGWSGLAVPYGGPEYWRDAQGVVRMRGAISGGANSTVPFTLPAGFRPPPVSEPIFAAPAFVSGSWSLGTIALQSNGIALYIGVGAPSMVHLSGITFRVD